MPYPLPRTKRPEGFQLEYVEFGPGETPREVREPWASEVAARRRARKLGLKRFDIWHSDGFMAVKVYASYAY